MIVQITVKQPFLKINLIPDGYIKLIRSPTHIIHKGLWRAQIHMEALPKLNSFCHLRWMAQECSVHTLTVYTECLTTLTQRSVAIWSNGAMRLITTDIGEQIVLASHTKIRTRLRTWRESSNPITKLERRWMPHSTCVVNDSYSTLTRIADIIDKYSQYY